MKVKELKELIKDLPDDMDVYKDMGLPEIEGNKWDFEVLDISNRQLIKRVKYLDGKPTVAQRACKETSGAKKCLIL